MYCQIFSSRWYWLPIPLIFCDCLYGQPDKTKTSRWFLQCSWWMEQREFNVVHSFITATSRTFFLPCTICSLSLPHRIKAKTRKWISLMLISKHCKKLITVIYLIIFKCYYFSAMHGNLDSFSILLQTTQWVTHRTLLTSVFSVWSETFLHNIHRNKKHFCNPNKPFSNSQKQN